MNSLKEIYEKIGLFYLGKDVDNNGNLTENLTLLKNKNFTTHAAIIGMTGSGKTGLGIGILEEAAIDNIPAIVIDPKGDMGDLLLTDPEFRPEVFKEWVKDEAIAEGEDPLEYAKKVAAFWKRGIESWGQDSERVARFSSVDKTIYTPGSNAGIPINILSSLKKPEKEIMEDTDSFSSYLSSTVSSLLSLINVEADSVDSKEFTFLSQLISYYWYHDKDIGIDTLVSSIINPPFKKVGVLPVESFYPENERLKLANRFNSIIASPSFIGWLSGEDLNIQTLLYGKDGKAKISIFSIAHLNDSEKMFFVTMLLNKIVAWMRMQSGTTRLRALLYMDEIYGFFPPVKNPPSKKPMLILLKQARAYGLGVVLSTQNPVDLDYKGLSNIGTWFIGRLQTTQDIDRVIDGLSGKVGSSFSEDEIRKILTNLKKRQFLLKSAHIDGIKIFNTRWALSYLKGPLKKNEISFLMADKKKKTVSTPLPVEKIRKSDDEFTEIVLVKGNLPQRFEASISDEKRYYPYVAASVDVYYTDSRRGINEKKEMNVVLNVENLDDYMWEESEELEVPIESFPEKPPSGAKFKHLPDFIVNDKSFSRGKRSLKNYIYANEKLELYRCRKLKLESKPGESYDDFMVKVEDVLKEKFEESVEKLKEKYEKRFDSLEARIERAKLQVEKEKADQTTSIIGAGLSIIGALFGRRKSVSKISSAVSKSGRVLKERGDMTRAQAKLQSLEEELEDLKLEFKEKVEKLREKYSPENYEIETIFIKPKKSLIRIKDFVLLWRTS